MSCWCGVRNPYFETVAAPCGGTGILYCICGGDFCVCHNHGEVECDGCSDCDFDLAIDDADFDEIPYYEPWPEPTAP